MNVAKYSLTDCGHVCAHFERSVSPGHYSNTDIDASKTANNYNLCKAERSGQVKYIKEKLDEIPHAKRKDLVCLCSVVLNAPKSLPQELHTEFFERAYEFLVNRYGSVAGFSNPEDVVVSCYRHMDESTDHIHFAFLPIKENPNGSQRFCAKEVICRDDLKTLHQDLDKYLREHGIRAEIVNGKTQRDAFGRALSVREMKYRDYKLERARSMERRRF